MVADKVGDWSPWRDRRFVVFGVGNVVNNIGEAIYNIALPLLAYQLTGSLLVMSLLATLVPVTLLLGPIVGVAVDRWGAGALVATGLVIQIVGGTVLNFVALASHVRLGLVFLFAAIVQVGGTLYRAGWMAGVATMFPRNPTRARGSLGALYVATGILGAVLVGALLPVVGYQTLLWLNVLTFMAPLAVYLVGIRPARTPSQSSEGLGKDIALGVRAVLDRPQLLSGMVSVVPLLFVGSGATLSLLTFHLRHDLDLSAADVGYLLAVVRCGSLFGTALVSEAREFGQSEY